MDLQKKALRVCLLSYRSNPHCGGQGVYIKNLSRALSDLGHKVEVLAGNPPPILDDDIKLTMVPGLDLYNPDNLNKTPSFKKLLKPVNFIEWFINATNGYPEPFIYGIKAYQYLKKRFSEFDIIHDNQSLSYGVLHISRYVPVVATIHHPMTRDRDIAVKSTRSLLKKARNMRWYSFISMQQFTARKLPHVITVSECSKQDIVKDYSIPENKISVIPNGIDTNIFYPVEGVEREKNRLIVTNSADGPLKGLFYLLHAVHKVSQKRAVFLTVIGTPKKGGIVAKLVKELNLGSIVEFTGRISNEEFRQRYAKVTAAVIPSVYEGFGLPVGEAMASRVPVICTTGGALPEVAGDAAVLVPPGDIDALADAIHEMFDNPEKARKLGADGYQRVLDQFSWKSAAEMTVDKYLKVIRER